MGGAGNWVVGVGGWELGCRGGRGWELGCRGGRGWELGCRGGRLGTGL